MDQVVICKGLTKEYDKKQILRNISFKVYKGQVVGLVGINGAGKTTLLRILSGLVYQTGGDILVCGVNPITAAERKYISFMPEHDYLFDTAKVKHLLNRITSIGRSLELKENMNIFELLDIYSMEDKKVKDLSKGMRQRLKIALTFLFEKELYILDEPTDGLDLNFRTILRSVVKMINNNGGTIIISSHNHHEIEKICNEVLYLINGNIKNIADSKERSTEIIYKQGDIFINNSRYYKDELYKIVVTSDIERKKVCKSIINSDGDIISMRSQSLEMLLKAEMGGHDERY